MSNLPNPYRILGITNRSVGPFGLLGVSPESSDRISVIRAMRSQLSRIDAHPENHSPEANELRQKIHIAANMLLDPDTLRELKSEYRKMPGIGKLGSSSGSGSNSVVSSSSGSGHVSDDVRRSRPERPPAINKMSGSPSSPKEETGYTSNDNTREASSASYAVVSGSKSGRGYVKSSLKSGIENNKDVGNSTSALTSEVRCLITNSLVSAGGWNRKSRAHIVAIASLYSVTNTQLRTEIMDLAAGRSVLSENPVPAISTPVTATGLKSRGQVPVVEESEFARPSSEGNAIAGLASAYAPVQGVKPDGDLEEDEEILEDRIATRNLIIAGLTFILGLLLTIPFGIFVLSEIRDYSISKRDNNRSVLVQSNTSAGNNSSSNNNTSRTGITETGSGISYGEGTGVNEVDYSDSEPMLLTYSQALDDFKRQLGKVESLDESLLDRFRVLISQGKMSWYKIDRKSRRKIQQFAVDVVYETGNRADDAQAIIDIIIPGSTPKIAGPNDIYSRVWSVGMLGVLVGETNLPGNAASLLQERSVRVFGLNKLAGGSPDPFNQAAEISLVNLVDVLMVLISDPRTDPVAMWQAWQAVVKAVSTDTYKKDELLCKTIQQLVISGPELIASESARMVLAILLDEINWQTSANGRRYLLAWFDNPRVSSEDLNVISSFIVTNSNIISLDETYILATDATSQARSVMRERYQQVWASFAGTAKSQLSDTDINYWFTQADKLINNYAVVSDIDLQLEQLVMLARMNLAASLLESDKAEDALKVMGESRRLISLAGVYDNKQTVSGNRQSSKRSTSEQITSATTYGKDGQWAILVAQAKKTNDRTLLIELIQTLAVDTGSRNYDLGTVDAASLVNLAIHGKSNTIRYEALRVIEQAFSQGPLTILALADGIPLDRYDSQLSAAIEIIVGKTLPDPKSSDWYVMARFALLEHVINLRGITGKSAYINAMSGLLNEAYEMRVLTFSGSALPDYSRGSSSNVSTGNPVSTRPNPARAAYKCFSAWSKRAQLMQPIKPLPASLDVIVRRYETRSELADDPLSTFAAAQLAVLEVITFVTAAERPDFAAELQQILAETTLSRAVADRRLEQLIAVEKAISQVWMIRLNRIQMKDLG